MQDSATQPTAFSMRAADGYAIKGHFWRHRRREDHPEERPVVIINPATSVHSRYYSRFATFLFDQGFDVVTYDYRGIGGSRPASLRGFQASWLDWGHLDFDAVLRYADRSFPGQPIHVVAHSIGGFVIGLAPSNHLIRRIFTMGAQFAHWRDYAPGQRLAMLAKWHVAMPALTATLRLFSGKAARLAGGHAEGSRPRLGLQLAADRGYLPARIAGAGKRRSHGAGPAIRRSIGADPGGGHDRR